MFDFNIRKLGIRVLLIPFLGYCSAPEYITPYQKLALVQPVQVFGTSQLLSVSDDDYNNNSYGLITASTLEFWRSNWAANHPSVISGRLIIFQISSGSLSGSYIRPEAGVRVYGISSSSTDYTFFGQTRFNGLMDTETIVPEGKNIDAFLKRFGVNPATDLIVLAQDVPSDGNLMLTLRSWYTMYYWGVEKNHLAVLNGAISAKIAASELTGGSSYTVPTTSGAGNLGGLYRDHTILQATLADVFNAVQGFTNPTFESSTPAPEGGSFILDARTAAEYDGSGTTIGASTYTCADTPSCYTPFEGHIKGAKNIPFANFINANKEFLPKSDLQNLLSTNGYTNGQTIIAYCRTNIRSSITGFATLAILGYPTRFYDGSWVEWGSLAYDPSAAWSNLSAVSPWRTDRSAVTESITYNVGKSGIDTSNISNLGNYFTPDRNFAKGTNDIIDQDKKYLSGSASSGGGGGGSGGGGGGNPCGG
ncbi:MULTISPECIES: sulfurtransferase [unclassified Leptospira]|uniref:sulfurtransferase n=1 Tax=unclassified Leptospira TaxID=2633828 RepID=UPI0002BED07E|nr:MULTISPECIES: sulfurtransferase [unclassified Leptospira]EMK00979.1 rhodanese-like protein [Leptospira sp. B5-022]MCR1795202.1 sulfurtransferase [Leptospira sp. id769339]